MGEEEEEEEGEEEGEDEHLTRRIDMKSNFSYFPHHSRAGWY